MSQILCILYNQRDATYTRFFIIISFLHVSGGFSTHHQELIKLYAQPWVLPCFSAVYRWCGWVGTHLILFLILLLLLLLHPSLSPPSLSLSQVSNNNL
jgi:hypothetical protein